MGYKWGQKPEKDKKEREQRKPKPKQKPEQSKPGGYKWGALKRIT